MEARTGQSLYLQENMCHVLSVHAKRVARTMTTAPLLRFVLFAHHVNYHKEHHLYLAVPHYNSRRPHDGLAQRGILKAPKYTILGRPAGGRSCRHWRL